MPSPFPGMDPYLEDPGPWGDFHGPLASEIRAELNRLLPPRYFARTEYRFEMDVYLDDEGDRKRQERIADVGATREPSGGVAVADLPRRGISPALAFRVEPEAIKRPFIEIREGAGSRRLVTVIEILSPANKSLGRDRRAYQDKQRETLKGGANLVEIDLLRTGHRVFGDEFLTREAECLEPRPDYLVAVSRARFRNPALCGYDVYPISIREILPCVGVPLLPEDADVPLDLQYVFDRVYDSGPYRRGAVDYRKPPVPPLSAGQAEWAAGLVRER